MPNSIWSDNTKISNREPLRKDITTDVLVIGGGLCGILCAYILHGKGIDCTVVEGSTIASGITKNTTAKITSQHSLIYDSLIQSYGKEKAQAYLFANQMALSKYERLCKNLDCDFEKQNSYIYSLTDIQKIEQEINAVNSLGYKALFTDKTPLPFKIKGAIVFENQAQFNPLKFISQISENLKIYENTFVKSIDKNYAYTNGGTIKANSIIVATHFPFINTHGSYFLKLYQERSYVCAYENAPQLNGMYLDENPDGFSFRNYNNAFIIGGSNHRTGEKTPAWKPMNEFMKEHYPQSSLKYQWATQDCMSLDKIPYIGHYSKNTPNMYVATGFNKWGMTSSMVSAIILSDMIAQKHNDYAEVFSPQRSMLKPQLFVNSFKSAFNLVTPTKKRCPHLGCALKWNKAEHSWDCPCHGSRFSKNGNIIDNPATKDLS